MPSYQSRNGTTGALRKPVCASSATTPFPNLHVTSVKPKSNIGAGIALANRMNNIDAKVYVVISEGERKGSTWEALQLIAHHG